MTTTVLRNLAIAAMAAGLGLGVGQATLAQTTPVTPMEPVAPATPAKDAAEAALDEATKAVKDAEAAAKASAAEAKAAVDAAAKSLQDAATPPDDPEADPATAGVPDDDDAAPAAATTAVQHHDYGPSGIMTRSNREDLAPLTLASGKPIAAGPYELKSGGYYRIDITADGSAELALSGGDFFRAIWINEVVINRIEIRPMGIHSIEFDEAGTASISFVAIQPGTFTLSIPGSTGETQKATFTIR